VSAPCFITRGSDRIMGWLAGSATGSYYEKTVGSGTEGGGGGGTRSMRQLIGHGQGTRD
jgi:hypothetical protein